MSTMGPTYLLGMLWMMMGTTNCSREPAWQTTGAHTLKYSLVNRRFHFDVCVNYVSKLLLSCMLVMKTVAWLRVYDVLS